jgi:MoaA/NifB/PqqE/SkfB family radical SAM enzyme
MSALETLQVAGKIGGAVANNRVSYLIVFVTAKCNLLCKHCFYTEEIQNAKSKHELTLEEYEKVAAKTGRALTNLNFTGGEPFIRTDLADIVSVFRKHTGVPFIGITTNGLLRERILDTVEKICSEKGPYFLKLGVSIDGFKDVHDKTRDRAGGFEETIKTIEALRPLRKRYPNLMVYVSTTITKYNKERIKPFIDFVKKDLNVDAHYLGYIRGNAMVDETKEVTVDEYREATDYLQNHWNSRSRFYNLLNMLNTLMLSVNRKIIEENKYVMPCVAGQKMLTLTEEGIVKPCEVLEQLGVSPYVMGDLRKHDYDISRVLESPAAKEIRRKILEERCFCTFECANQASIVYKPTNLVHAGLIYSRQRIQSWLGNGRPN